MQLVWSLNIWTLFRLYASRHENAPLLLAGYIAPLPPHALTLLVRVTSFILWLQGHDSIWCSGILLLPQFLDTFALTQVDTGILLQNSPWIVRDFSLTERQTSKGTFFKSLRKNSWSPSWARLWLQTSWMLCWTWPEDGPVETLPPRNSSRWKQPNSQHLCRSSRSAYGLTQKCWWSRN